MLPALLLCLVLGGAGTMFGFKPALVPVDLPPAGWDKLGTRPGYTVKTFDSLHELQQYCHDTGSTIEPPKRAGQPYVEACTNTGERVIALPSPKAWPNPGERRDLENHENAHSWGLIHDPSAAHGGRGTWLTPSGQPAQPLSPASVLMMKGLAAQSQPPEGVLPAQASSVLTVPKR